MSTSPAYHYVSWEEVQRDTRALAAKLLPLGPWRGLIALTRGGMVPTAIIARELGIHLIETYCISSYDDQDRNDVKTLKLPREAMESQGEGWILIDDLVDTGATAKAARETLPKAKFATLYAKPQGEKFTDVYVIPVEQHVWVRFPWDCGLSYVPPLAEHD